MGCDTGIKPRKAVQANANVTEQPTKEMKAMSSTMVRREMPTFTMDL